MAILLFWRSITVSNLKTKFVSIVTSLRGKRKESNEDHVPGNRPRTSKNDQLSNATVTHTVIDIKSYGALE